MFCIMIFFFLIKPDLVFEASANGIVLWLHQILPTLLPFTILSNLLMSSNLFPALKRRLKHRARDFSLLSPEECFIILCGFLFGFPIGSKLASDMCENGIVPQKRAQLLCAFTNNLSPVFVSSFVCNSQFKRSDWILPTYLILYGPPLILGLLWLIWERIRNPVQMVFVDDKKTASGFQMDMQIIDAGILNGFETLIRLCGYIVMFSICASMLSQCSFLSSFIRMVLIGCTEVTNGIARLAQYPCDSRTSYLLMMLFLSFGGLSGIAQTGSMIHRAELSLFGYVKTKLCFVLCSMLLAICYVLFLG